MKIISPRFTDNFNFSKPLTDSMAKKSQNNLKDIIFYTDNTKNTDFYHTKMLHASKTMKEIDDEIIILVDAFDVIVNKPLDGIIEEFKKFDCKLLISAEANCFPFKEYEFFLSQHSETKLKFPCAGCWIGYRDYMIELFDSKLSIDNHIKWRQHTDQGFMQTIYYKSFFESNYSVKIDTQAKIFINTFLLEEKKDFILNEKKQFVYNETSNIPYFVHFNGDGKKHMPLFGYKYCE